MCNGDCKNDKKPEAAKPASNDAPVKTVIMPTTQRVEAALRQVMPFGDPAYIRNAATQLHGHAMDRVKQLTSGELQQSQKPPEKAGPLPQEGTKPQGRMPGQALKIDGRLIEYVPPVGLSRVWMFLSAYIPWAFGLLAKKAWTDGVRQRCLSLGVRCKSCRQQATWNEDSQSFHCKDCDEPVMTLDEAIELGSPCQYLVQKKARLFCGACGCGEHERAHLGYKTQMKNATCPLNLWPKHPPGVIKRGWRRVRKLTRRSS
jgi:hypothetical protein